MPCFMYVLIYSLCFLCSLLHVSFSDKLTFSTQLICVHSDVVNSPAVSLSLQLFVNGELYDDERVDKWEGATDG